MDMGLNLVKKEELDDSASCEDKTNEDTKNGEVKFSGTNSFSKELARLQFFGAGPKMAGLPAKNKSEKTLVRSMTTQSTSNPNSDNK